MLKGNGAGANKYLKSDASGNATWSALPAATVTTANNGLSMSGTTTQLGGTLTKATTITGNTTNTLTLAVPTTIGTDAAKSDLTVKGNETVGGALTVGSANRLPVGAALGVQTLAPNAGVATSTKGFMYPRVSLTSVATLAPLVVNGGTATEKVEHKGLTVYHIGNAALEEGAYIWNGRQWMKVLTEVPVKTSVISDLNKSIYAPLLRWDRPQFGAELSFSTPLEIKEDGSYALMLRFYGEIHEEKRDGTIPPKLPSSMLASSIYIWVYRSGQTTPVDAAELAYTVPDAALGTYIAAFTAALTVPNAKEGETLSIRIGTNENFKRFNFFLKAGSVPNAARTSLFYWKL